MNNSLSPFAPENLVSRDGFGSPVPRQPVHLHTQAESGAYLRASSRFDIILIILTRNIYFEFISVIIQYWYYNHLLVRLRRAFSSSFSMGSIGSKIKYCSSVVYRSLFCVLDTGGPTVVVWSNLSLFTPFCF